MPADPDANFRARDPDDALREQDDAAGVVTVAFTVTEAEAGERLDRFLTDRLAAAEQARDVDETANRLRGHSRTFLTRLIREGEVAVRRRGTHVVVKPATRLRAGDEVTLAIPPPPPSDLVPEAIPLDVLFEDDVHIVVNKSAGLVVHPTSPTRGGTLANALLHHCGMAQVSRLHGDAIRPGIVHRLDRDTSGVIVCAKDEWAHYRLARQFHDRQVEKEYLALAHGDWLSQGNEIVIDQPIARHPRHRELMRAIPIGDEVPSNARSALTRFDVQQRFTVTDAEGRERRFTWVVCRPRTGRTHQIRVHALAAGHPLVCDKGYSASRGNRLTRADLGLTDRDAPDDAVLLARQALHAHRLTITHPVTGERRTFEAPLPPDLAGTLAALEQASR